MKKITAAVLIFMGIITFAQSSKEVKVKELMEVMGVSKIAVQSTKQFYQYF